MFLSDARTKILLTSAFLVLAAWLLLTGLSLAVEPQKAKPTLRINASFAATLWRLDVDASEQYVVSSSAYKAVNVWPLDDLQSKSILRVPIRKEQSKRAHGVAISPIGKLVASSVPPRAANNGLPLSSTAKIYLLDRKSGEQLAQIDGIATRPQALRFSPDGIYLAAVLSDGCGLRVWKAPDWKLFYSDDKDYGGGDQCTATGRALDVDAKPDTTSLAFSKNNDKLWLVTSGDSGVRTYGLKGNQAIRLAFAKPGELELERPGDVSFSPDGSKLLIGDRRNRALDGAVHLRVAVISVDTLKVARKPFAISEDHLKHPAYLDRKQNADANQTSLEQVAWVKTEDDEEWVFVGGVFWCTFVNPDLILGEITSVADICIARFSALDEDEDPAFIPVGTDRVMELIGLPKRGGLLYATQRRIGLMDYEGEALELGEGQELSDRNMAADFRDGGMAFSISADGKKIVFDDYRGRYGERLRLQFDLTKRRLTRLDDDGEGVSAPNHDKNLIEGWRNSRKPPLIYGEPLRDDHPVLDDFYRSAAIVTDQKLVLLGSSDFLRLVVIDDEAGAKTLCRVRIDHEAFRVNLTPDGRTAIVGHSDGTLRWYRIERTVKACKFHKLLSVHIAQDELGEWIWAAWLPSGRFANDPRAKKQIGWQVERQAGKVSFVPYRKLLRLYDDNAVKQALDQAIPQARVRGFLPIINEAAQNQQGTHVGLRVALPLELAEVTNKMVRFQIDTSGLPKSAGSLQIKTGSGVNMVKIVEGQRIEANKSITLNQQAALALDVELPATARRSNRAVHVCFHVDEKAGPCHALIWQGKIAPAKKRRLWAIIIGISKHQFSSYDLQYTQNDALDIAQLFVDDHQKRSLNSSAVSPDFSSINISLIVSPKGQSTSEQLTDLTALPYVRRYESTRAGILQALNNIVNADSAEELSNDLFFFHFSGHGFIHPYNKDRGRSAFVTYATDPALTKQSIKDQVFTSEDLIGALKQISAEKLVIFDACRVPVGNLDAVPFDPGMISAEFQDQVLSAHYFFSGLAGQYSLDQRKYAINAKRPFNERGNGLFSYAFLKALTDKKADLPGKKAGRDRIEIVEVKRYLDRQFDLDDEKSLANEFRNRFKKSDIQQPVYVPARKHGGRQGSAVISVLRTLDP
ncbi:MAG: hypothetical protein GY927_05830 [bacterium]|nr:hypothetical protein [bacterium]